jgi:hypothetical protein
MKPSTDPWNGTGPMLVVGAWLLAAIVTTAAIVAGVTWGWNTLTGRGT